MGLRYAIADVRSINELLTTAEREAAGLGDEMPGAEHLLLAALSHSDESARVALDAVGVSTDAVRAAVREVHAAVLGGIALSVTADSDAEHAPGPRGPYASTGTAQRVFQRARELSKRERPARLRSAHVVLAVAELTHGTAARVLSRLEVDRGALEAAVRHALATT